MKKVRIMLMATLVVATVGGALAFKARSFGLKCGSASNSCATPDNDHAYTFTTGTAISGVFCTDGTNTTICKPVTTEQ